MLKYKRIDGVDAALRSIADQVFGGGHQHELIGDRLAELQFPLLVVWGAEDRILPAEHARRVPESADVHVLEGSGHSPHMEAPGDVNRLMQLTLEPKEISL